MKDKKEKKCLVTGATGYIGGRLVPKLLELGYIVRVMVRDRNRLEGRSWKSDVEVVEADVLKPETLDKACKSVDYAYYLIHSMSGDGEEDFHERDRTAAQNFGKAAKDHQIKRIIYLGGLGSTEQQLSRHLKSRHETGRVLRKYDVPLTEFRAAIVVGSGSKSFEMIRYLTERVPLMICPKWVFSKVQPIAIRDVLSYLAQAVHTPASKGKIIQIGGNEVLTYGEMMKRYAKIKGLKRILLPVPFLTPKLSSHWVHWMTPIPASLARPLIEGLKNDVVVTDNTAEDIFPSINPISYTKAVELALNRVDMQDVETTWNDALISSNVDEPVLLKTEEGLIIERRQKKVNASEEEVFKSFTGLGGDRGWLAYNWAWKLRGILDRLVGGVGFRRGRRHPDELRIGDALDFWRVESIQENNLLRLRAEMKVPGRAWLEFQAKSLVQQKNGKSTRLIQTAYFDPKGLLGLAYWYVLYPIHSLIFSRMIDVIGQVAEQKKQV